MKTARTLGCKSLALLSLLSILSTSHTWAQQRVLGIDVSIYQGVLVTTNWTTFKRPTNQQVGGVFGDGRDFVLIRASRGGTTGEDHRQGGYSSGNNTQFSLSQRYDDPYFVQNINRATAAGMFAGSYHFGRHDVIESTANSGGIANTGTDEANHFIQMAGAWMRPGYLLPVFDLEGPNVRTVADLATFCIDFSDRIYVVMGIRPMMYINGTYTTTLQGAPAPAALVTAYPKLWNARYTSNDDPSSTAYLTGNPKDSFSGFYGPWDDAPNPTHPWSFWQYSSQGGLNGYSGAIDKNVANGGTEFLKDHLVPAVWMNDSNGQWTTLSNWNSGQTPTAPISSAGQLTPPTNGPLPTPRFPESNDTVVLDRPSANVTVTLASGTQTIRKLYVSDTLNVTGGTLNISYIPASDSTPISAQISGPVTVNNSGNLTAHTIQVDATNNFTIGGAHIASNNPSILIFSTVKLTPHSTTPAKMISSGPAIFRALTNGVATITNGTGAGSSGRIDLGGGNRTFNVTNGTDLFVWVPITNGTLTKSGAGTMHLGAVSTYTGGTIVSAGKLLVNSTSGLGSSVVTVSGGILGGTGTISGAVTVNSGGTITPGPGTSIGTLTLNSAPTFNGTNFMKIDRNNGSSRADKIVLTAGTLNYGGTLAISNAGLALAGGEVFTNFTASGYGGSFANYSLPNPGPGLNWYVGNLTVNGTIKVNRQPTVGALTFTNNPNGALTISKASLLGAATDLDGDTLSLASITLTTTNGITMTTNASSIFYTNSLSVMDRFTFTISDNHGGTAQGSAQIVPSSAGKFSGFPNVTENSTTLHIAGRANTTYYIDRSTNLPVFVPISTNIAPPSGLFDYIDNSLPRPPSALYRLRSNP
jgi:autotransporter-associated beta strand protein